MEMARTGWRRHSRTRVRQPGGNRERAARRRTAHAGSTSRVSPTSWREARGRTFRSARTKRARCSDCSAITRRFLADQAAAGGPARECIQGRRSGGTDDFVITRKFDAIATHAEKLALIDALFTVTAVDASIVTVEDNEIRRIANELKIEHAESSRSVRDT